MTTETIAYIFAGYWVFGIAIFFYILKPKKGETRPRFFNAFEVFQFLGITLFWLPVTSFILGMAIIDGFRKSLD